MKLGVYPFLLCMVYEYDTLILETNSGNTWTLAKKNSTR